MRSTILLALVAAVVGCSGSNDSGPPADVAGNYTLTVTDGQNGCNVENFTTNATQSGIAVAITQSGSSVSATATSYSGLMLAFAAGNTLNGTIDGSQAVLSASADRAQGSCAYTTTVTATFRFVDTQVQGSVLYQNAGNGSSDCGALQQCTSTQTFAGSR